VGWRIAMAVRSTLALRTLLPLRAAQGGWGGTPSAFECTWHRGAAQEILAVCREKRMSPALPNVRGVVGAESLC